MLNAVNDFPWDHIPTEANCISIKCPLISKCFPHNFKFKKIKNYILSKCALVKTKPNVGSEDIFKITRGQNIIQLNKNHYFEKHDKLFYKY